MLVANEEFVRLRKEELEEKSKKCDKLESENGSLKRSLEIKVWMYMYLLCSYYFFFSESSATVIKKST
jgi:hypothetical protein